MKEVNCICGQRVVFLDPEVDVKTCPNCGGAVYQNQPSVDRKLLIPRKKPPLIAHKGIFAAGVIVVAAFLLLAAGGISAARKKAISEAEVAVRMARAADDSGDWKAAAAFYADALRIYSRWHAGGGAVGESAEALAKVNLKIAEAAGHGAEAASPSTLLPISLEELARQAYAGSPASWTQTFDSVYAGRAVILAGKVEEKRGGTFEASSLTISYRIWSPAGMPVEIGFDGPFFERYRLKAGSDCIIRAILSKMRIEKDGPGQSEHWVLVIDAAASGLVTDIAQLKGLGWNTDEETARIITEQQQLLPAY